MICFEYDLFPFVVCLCLSRPIKYIYIYICNILSSLTYRESTHENSFSLFFSLSLFLVLSLLFPFTFFPIYIGCDQCRIRPGSLVFFLLILCWAIFATIQMSMLEPPTKAEAFFPADHMSTGIIDVMSDEYLGAGTQSYQVRLFVVVCCGGVCVCLLSLFLSFFSFSRSHTLSLSHSHSLSLTLSHTLSLTHSLFLTLPLSLSHTHTHTLSLSLSLIHTHSLPTHTLSLPLTLPSHTLFRKQL